MYDLRHIRVDEFDTTRRTEERDGWVVRNHGKKRFE